MRQVAFMAGAIIFATGVVMGCDNKSEPPVVGHGNRADSADQVMFKARFNLTDNGLSRAELTADSALFFDDNTRVELRNVEELQQQRLERGDRHLDALDQLGALVVAGVPR